MTKPVVLMARSTDLKYTLSTEPVPAPVVLSGCPTGQGAKPMGLVVANRHLHSTLPRLSACVVTEEGTPLILSPEDLKTVTLTSIAHSIPGILLMKNGVGVHEFVEDPHTRPAIHPYGSHPRIVLGIREDDTLVLVLAKSATVEECVYMLRPFGVRDALMVSWGANSFAEVEGKRLWNPASGQAAPLTLRLTNYKVAPRPFIMLDPGHGGADSGATANGLAEKDLNLSHAKAVYAALKNFSDSCTPLLTRSDDRTLSLKERTDIANALKADLFLSIHANAGGGDGFESFIYPTTSLASKEAQKALHESIMRALEPYGVRDRGRKTANFHVLRETAGPAVLIEVLFVDGKTDPRLLKDPKVLEAVDEAIVKALVNLYGLKPSEPKFVPGPKKLTLWTVQVGAFSEKWRAEQVASRLKEMGFDVWVRERE